MPIGPRELLIILLVVVLLFGAKKLPELARSMGRSMRIFKSEVNEMKTENEQQGQLAKPANQTDEEFWNSPGMQPRQTQPRSEGNPNS